MFKYQSGRVVSLGRAMLALLFLISIWLDPSPANQSAQATTLLVLYLGFAFLVAALTWRNWWLDARLAIPVHIADMAVFTAVVFSTNGYTSPFFLFFMLPLLSAALRWGWRETALTAAALILLYLCAGLLVTGEQAFELRRFIIRSGHLLILSAVLIWFGIHQQFTRLFFGLDELDRRLSRDEDALPQALEVAMEAVRAGAGALLIASSEGDELAGVAVTPEGVRHVSVQGLLVREVVSVVLFDLDRNRALTDPGEGWYSFTSAAKHLNRSALRGIGAGEGLVARVKYGTRSGWLVLWDVKDLSVDFLDLGSELGRVVAAVLERFALISAIEQGAAARTRLSLARDVHDSVVQFLAGASFRVEAIMRGARAGRQVESDLTELKRLLIEEQGEIRTFIAALRRDRELELTEAVEDLKAVARRLAQQWSIDCHVDASNDDASIPIRLQLELQQLLREAVANAVRHGGASRVDVDVGVADDQLRLHVKDNGSGFGPSNGASPVEPWSLRERVDRAQGSLSLYSEPGCTNLLITLPLTGVSA
ncbi:MAG TPA: ATP-binding protein [Sphingomicrobium sp.]|jgi:signal transduction histidine kinase|nr:ATP-binding protein [Sphingomicrobium sp.]